MGSISFVGICRTWPLVAGVGLVPLVWSRSLNDNFTEPKWFVLRMVAGIALISAATFWRSVRLPQWSWVQWFFVLSWVLFSLLNPVIQQTYFWAPEVWVDRLVLFAFVFLFLQAQKSDEIFEAVRLPVVFSGLLVCIISFIQFVLFRVIESQPSPRFFSGTFGENNMCAQFLVFALPFGLLQRAEGESRRWKWLSFLGSALNLAFLLLHQSRSALIGAVLILLWSTVTAGRSARLRLLSILFAAIGISSGLSASQTIEASFFDKASSNSDRLELYLETLQMIELVPLGVGAGRFEFDSIPFLRAGQFKAGEGILYRSPHSEPLRFLAEEGIVWSLLCLCLLIALFSANRTRWRGVIISVGNQGLTAPLALAALPEFLFQFPLHNAVPIPFFGLLISRLVNRSSVVCAANSYVRGLLVLFGLGIVSSGLIIALANYKATTAEDPREFIRACKLNPSNWYLCSLTAQYLIESGDTKSATELMLDELGRRPFNFVALRSLGVAHWHDQKPEKACEFFLREQKILGPNHSNSQFVEENCPALLSSSILHSSPLDIYRDQLHWARQLGR